MLQHLTLFATVADFDYDETLENCISRVFRVVLNYETDCRPRFG